jgi:hypothetical protein
VYGFFQLVRLAAASTFWRYVDSIEINQADSILRVGRVLRERAWYLCGLRYRVTHVSINTMAETI